MERVKAQRLGAHAAALAPATHATAAADGTVTDTNDGEGVGGEKGLRAAAWRETHTTFFDGVSDKMVLELGQNNENDKASGGWLKWRLGAGSSSLGAGAQEQGSEDGVASALLTDDDFLLEQVTVSYIYIHMYTLARTHTPPAPV